MNADQSKLFAEFQAFLQFLQWKNAQADSSSISSTESERPYVRKINYEKVMSLLTHVKPNVRKSKHYALYAVFQNLLISNPEFFHLTGEGHPSADGRFYFSFQYKNGYSTVNFHVYGRVEGLRFIFETVDILMNTYEKYIDAVDFRKD